MDSNSFEYSGRLVFSFYFARFKEQWSTQPDFISELLQRLSEYEEGTPENPGEGYTEIELLDQLEPELELPQWMLDEVGEWTCIQYHHEEYTTEKAFVDEEEKREVLIPSTETVDLYFHPSGLTLLRGKSSAIHHVTSKLQHMAAGDLLFDAITVNPRELYEFQNSDIRIGQTQKAEFNSMSASTDKVSISGKDIRSDSIVQRAQEKGQIIRHMGEIQFADYSLFVDIRQDKIFIRARRDLKNLSDASRLILSILFCHRVLKPQIEEEVRELP